VRLLGQSSLPVGNMSNQDNGSARGVATWATALAAPGAFAQAGNNAAAALFRNGLTATFGVSDAQALAAALTVSFAAAAAISAVLWWTSRGTPRAFTWRVSQRVVLAWHEARLVVGLAATSLIFFAAMNALQTGLVSVGLITVLISTAPIYLAALELAQKRWTSLPVTLLGFGGIALASWQSIVGVKAFVPAIPAALLAGLLLAALQLVQKRLGGRYGEPAPKVVGIFAVQALFLSVIFFGVASLHTGVLPTVTTPVLQAGGALAACYGTSQLLLQLANGFGNPALVGVVTYLQLPAGFVIDWILFHRLPTSAQLIGTGLIVASAFMAVSRRND
jgi:drug/metabolite transporter (DMT)-like permease